MDRGAGEGDRKKEAELKSWGRPVPRILLVDERKDIRDFIARFFTERNFEVSDAASGADAITAVKRDRPDIVLLELKMEDMDGIELLKRIRKVKPDTKVIAVSCVDDIEVISEAKRLGIISYLTKPVILSELMEVVLKNLGTERRFFRLKKVPR